MTNKPSIICPMCGKDDQIQKVNAIFTTGVSVKSETQVSHRLRGDRTTEVESVSVTGLAGRIRPPERPDVPFYASQRVLVGIIGLFVPIWLCGPLAFSRGFNDRGPNGIVLGLMCVVPLAVLFLIVNAIENKKLEPKLKAWGALRDKWLSLYYCYRDDVVFDPSTGVHVSPERINELVR